MKSCSSFIIILMIYDKVEFFENFNFNEKKFQKNRMLTELSLIWLIS